MHAYFSAIALRRFVSVDELVNQVLSMDIALVEELRSQGSGRFG